MIYLDDYAISLDRREKDSDIDFISHAHSDHTSAAKSSKSVIASRETAALLKAINNIELKGFRDSMDGVRLIDSGHVLGSKQIRIESPQDGVITYTGDFMVQKPLTCKPIQILDTDALIIDSTYSTPEIKFDDRREVERAIELWTRRKFGQGIVLFGVHALGKAQEIIRILNDSGIVPVASKKISAINKVYSSHGFHLEYDDCAPSGGNFVGIFESHKLDEAAAEFSRSHNRRVFRAVATGWAKIFRFNTDVQFSLSDHADFRQSIYYIEAAAPKKILTYGSNADAFANNLSKLGYNAEPFRTEAGLQYRVMQGSVA